MLCALLNRVAIAVLIHSIPSPFNRLTLAPYILFRQSCLSDLGFVIPEKQSWQPTRCRRCSKSAPARCRIFSPRPLISSISPRRPLRRIRRSSAQRGLAVCRCARAKIHTHRQWVDGLVGGLVMRWHARRVFFCGIVWTALRFDSFPR